MLDCSPRDREPIRKVVPLIGQARIARNQKKWNHQKSGTERTEGPKKAFKNSHTMSQGEKEYFFYSLKFYFCWVYKGSPTWSLPGFDFG